MRCEICGKTTCFGKKLAHDRLYVNGRTSRTFHPNLHKIRVADPEGRRQIVACTRCMRTRKKKGLLSPTNPIR